YRLRADVDRGGHSGDASRWDNVASREADRGPSRRRGDLGKCVGHRTRIRSAARRGDITMTDLGLMDDEEPRPARRNRRRRRKRKRGGSVMAVLLSLTVVGALGYGIYYGGSQIFDAVGEWFADGED